MVAFLIFVCECVIFVDILYLEMLMENSVTLLYMHVLWNVPIKPLTYFLQLSAFRFGENIENPLLAYAVCN